MVLVYQFFRIHTVSRDSGGITEDQTDDGQEERLLFVKDPLINKNAPKLIQLTGRTTNEHTNKCIVNKKLDFYLFQSNRFLHNNRKFQCFQQNQSCTD